MARVTIIGAGVIGLCSAYYLRKQGHDVVVVDRGDVTDGCSFGNMGYISPSHFIPLATPGIISQGIRWMLSASSPFYVKPRLNMDLLRWGMQFWKSSNAKQVERSVPHLNNLLQLSRRLTNELAAELPAPFDLTEKGCFMLYREEKTGDHEKEMAEQAASLGLKTITCTAQEVQNYEPDVEVSVAGGILYLDDCHLHPARFMKAMYQTIQGMGVKFWLNTEVTGFEKENGRVTKIITDKSDLAIEELVIANGSWMEQISSKLGIRLLMQPGKGYSVEYHGLEKNLRHPSILVDDRTATTPIGGWLRIGGTMELSGHSDTILPKRVLSIYDAFLKYYPSMQIDSPDTAKAWFGYRPVTPDGMPYIGRCLPFSNVVFAGGHAMLGVSAAAGTGKLVTEIVERTTTSIDISAFDPGRFR